MAKGIKRKQSVYGIWRVDHDASRTHCWVVRIQRRQKVWRRSFSDLQHSGKAKALAAAKAYRDSIIARHPPMTRAEYVSIRRRNNRSGVPGVCRHIAVETVEGRAVERIYWIGFWTTRDGRPARRKFSVAKHGEEGVFRRARQARREAVATLEGPHLTSRGLRAWLRRHSKT